MKTHIYLPPGAKRRPRDSENIRTIVNIHDYIYSLELCIYTIYDDTFRSHVTRPRFEGCLRFEMLSAVGKTRENENNDVTWICGFHSPVIVLSRMSRLFTHTDLQSLSISSRTHYAIWSHLTTLLELYVPLHDSSVRPAYVFPKRRSPFWYSARSVRLCFDVLLDHVSWFSLQL